MEPSSHSASKVFLLSLNMAVAMTVGICCLAAKWNAYCRLVCEAGESVARDSRSSAEAAKTLARAGGPGRVGAQSGLGPIWALMGPHGPSWTGLGGLGRFRKLSVNFP